MYLERGLSRAFILFIFIFILSKHFINKLSGYKILNSIGVGAPNSHPKQTKTTQEKLKRGI